VWGVASEWAKGCSTAELLVASSPEHPTLPDALLLRTTPALLGLFSLVTIWADELAQAPANAVRPRTAAWYSKREPTFSDAIAAVRRALWCPSGLSMSHPSRETVEIPAALLQRLTDTLCHAA